MPGLLEHTMYQGYDYICPYVEKAQPYVEVARNNVPLVDPALKTAEELLPTLITRADEIAEPRIEKMRPFVGPRIEQVKERVAPYVDEGVKQYGVLREEGVKFYRVGLEKVEQVKGFKDAKVEQVMEFKDAKEIQIKNFAAPKVEKIKEFTDPKVEKIKEFTDHKVVKIKEFTDPTVEKIKELIEPKMSFISKLKSVLSTKKQKIQTIIRVPASLDLQGLKYESVLGKLASWMEKMEAVVDRYMPLTEEQKKDNDSDFSNASDTSTVRINRSVISIMTRPIAVLSVAMAQVPRIPAQLRKSSKFGTDYCNYCMAQAKNKTKQIAVKVEPILTQVNEKLTPKVATLTQTSLFKKFAQLAISSSEKTFGNEKTMKILKKIDAYIPSEWKVGTPPVHEQEPKSEIPAESPREENSNGNTSKASKSTRKRK